jgi:phosphoglycolate phosphatase
MHSLVIFDFDGTLGDTHRCTTATLDAVFNDSGHGHVTQEMMIPLFGSPLELFVATFLGDASSPDLIAELTAQYRMRYPDFVAENTRLYPGIRELLDELANRKILCAIATTKTTHLAEVSCDFLGISRYFHMVIGIDKVTHPKPDAETANQILEQLKVKPADALVVGDSRFDIGLGHSAGIESIAVTWGSYSEAELRNYKPTAVISKPSELLQYL